MSAGQHIYARQRERKHHGQLGSQGILVVDSQPASLSTQVLEALAKLSAKPIRYLINTSADPAHTGGNDALRRAGVQVFAVQERGPSVTRPTARPSSLTKTF